MPYVDERSKELFEMVSLPMGEVTVGELNYGITKLVDAWLMDQGISYSSINAAIGVLECAKLELYRRIAAPYEDSKKAINGDAYSRSLLKAVA
jgi:hypothetical protein